MAVSSQLSATLSGSIRRPERTWVWARLVFSKDHTKMRQTLRRSCAACAKSKHSCDLATPRCSRCIIKGKLQCVYANEPLTTPPAAPSKTSGEALDRSTGTCTGTSTGTLAGYRFSSVDPFDSYPQTRLPRSHVQRLIHSCTCLLILCRRRSFFTHQLTYLFSSPQDSLPILSS